MPHIQNIIAIVYDYDRTLSPRSMQDDVVFPRIGVGGVEFWGKVGELKATGTYEDELAWIRLLLDNPVFRKFSNHDLNLLGSDLEFYPGIPELFVDLASVLHDEQYVSCGISLEHYIVTSGLKAILSGSLLSQYVESIFGCELDEDEQGHVYWPKRVISHTSKTQYLFRITKGREYVNLSHDVNDHMPETERRIPFKNMIYIGDGPTDVPSFAVITGRGGKALAVYDSSNKSSFATCMALRDAQRVNEIAEADYRHDTHLRRLLEHYLVQIADRMISEQKSDRESRVIHAPRHS